MNEQLQQEISVDTNELLAALGKLKVAYIGQRLDNMRLEFDQYKRETSAAISKLKSANAELADQVEELTSRMDKASRWFKQQKEQA